MGIHVTPIPSDHEDERDAKQIVAFNEDIQNALADMEKGGRYLSKAKGRIRKVSRKDSGLAERMQSQYDLLAAEVDEAKEEGEIAKLMERIEKIFDEIEEQLEAPEPPRRYGNPESAAKFIKKLEKIDAGLAEESREKIEQLNQRIERAKSGNERDELVDKLKSFLDSKNSELDEGRIVFTNSDIEARYGRVEKLRALDATAADKMQAELDALKQKLAEKKGNASLGDSTQKVEGFMNGIRKKVLEEEAIDIEPSRQEFNNLLDRHLKGKDDAAIKRYTEEYDNLSAKAQARNKKISAFIEATTPIDKYMHDLEELIHKLRTYGHNNTSPYQQIQFEQFYQEIKERIMEGGSAKIRTAWNNLQQVVSKGEKILDGDSPYVGLTSSVTTLNFFKKRVEENKKQFFDRRDEYQVEFDMDSGDMKPIKSYQKLLADELYLKGVALLFPEDREIKEYLEVAAKTLKGFGGIEGAKKKTYQNWLNYPDTVSQTVRGKLDERESNLAEMGKEILEKQKGKRFGAIKRMTAKGPDWFEVRHILSEDPMRKVAVLEYITEDNESNDLAVHWVHLVKERENDRYGEIKHYFTSLNYRPILAKNVREHE